MHGKREVTTTAPQALALINSDLVYGWSQVLAGRAIREAGDKDNKRVARLFEILYAREPSKEETKTLLAFLDSQEKLLAAQLAEGKTIVAPDGYGENPQVGVELDQLYQTLYGRSADRYEKAALVSFVQKQQKPARQGGRRQAPTAAGGRSAGGACRGLRRPGACARELERIQLPLLTIHFGNQLMNTHDISQGSSDRCRPRCRRPGA